MNTIKKLLKNEVVLYLIFGVATTLVYMVSRLFLSAQPAAIAAVIANIIATLFAFVTNDRIVFAQQVQGWFPRLIKFTTARLFTMALDVALAWIFVQQFPQIIGQFVHNNDQLVNAIETVFAQGAVIVLNYILSKFFVFTKEQED